MQGLTLRHRALALTVLLLCFSALVFGQGYQGGLRGRVMDAQGAVIANAKVEITDDATNSKRDTVSNAEGEFVFSAVNPATYTLSAENAGFKKFERKVIIGTQEFITLDEVGSRSDHRERAGE
jgi:protocatechuate 3,4-dioxygenase beta subunit